ncbi:hypothetical protein DPMN_167496 [Dreissena polymorpha]|uniref:Uncharacterized protein n=1 Tax=Dreissena polymorpha TaxID=45954 RepID=A0A9D4IV36_DREPO|nr:hypothetical protein DPMN_167496 [Dreissena polymorpha]
MHIQTACGISLKQRSKEQGHVVDTVDCNPYLSKVLNNGVVDNIFNEQRTNQSGKYAMIYIRLLKCLHLRRLCKLRFSGV